MLKPDYLDFDNDGNKNEPMKTALKEREEKNEGGLLRAQFKAGKLVKMVKELTDMFGSDVIKKKPTEKISPTEANELSQFFKENITRDVDDPMYMLDNLAIKELDELSKGSKPQTLNYFHFIEEDMSPKQILDAYIKIPTVRGNELLTDLPMSSRAINNEGGLLEDDMAKYENDMPTHTMPDGTVMPGAEHGESEMESDDVMEDNYLDFIINEALTEEEEDMLMSKLEQDEELSMLFDKVIEVASEFAGSGPVEGPGTGVSDSIPARLSDGEFVFTAKAVEEIGADNLMAMMKEAEMKADERQPVQTGGLMQQDEEAYQPTAAPMTEQVIRVERGPQSETVGVGGSMLDPSRMEPTNPLYDEMPFKRPPVHGAGY